MKKIFLLLSVAALLCVSCGRNMERKAQALLEEARQAYNVQDYGKSKLMLDSIRNTYPKAFKVRREALKLGRDVEMGEQRRSMEFYEKELASLQARRDTLLKKFVLEKDSRYQDVGNYMLPAQTVKNNLNNTYLRAQVSEEGVAVLSSVYRGKAIQHDKVQVSSGDSYAECSSPFNKYSSKHLGVTTERLDFRYGEDGGIMDFIAACNAPVTVKLDGKSSYKYALRETDVQAIIDVLELTRILQAVNSATEMRDDAKRHVEFLERNNARVMK